MARTIVSLLVLISIVLCQPRATAQQVEPSPVTRRSLVTVLTLSNNESWCWGLTALLFCLGFALSASVSIVLVKVRRVEIALLVVVVIYGLIVYLRHRYAQRLASDANI